MRRRCPSSSAPHPLSRMRRRGLRGVATLLLFLFALLFLLPGVDHHAHEDQHHTHASLCTLFCLDDCTTASLPEIPAVPPRTPLPTPDFGAEVPPAPLFRSIEPEHTPPRR